MCQLNITSVIGVSTGNGINLTVDGTSSNCPELQVKFTSISGIPLQTVFPSVSGTWTAIFQDLPVNCGDEYQIEVCCIDNGNINDDCSLSHGGAIECQSNCCLDPEITFKIGTCDSQGNIPVTFTIDGNATDPNCLPYEFAMDFGDGTSTPFNGTIIINSLGAFSFSFPVHTYDPLQGPYTAILQYSVANGSYNTCSPIPIALNLEPCPPVNCCPDPQIDIVVKDCNDACRREVEIATSFNPPPSDNCPHASMQWEYFDASNNSIQNGQIFTNYAAGTHTDTVYFTASQSPITAKLRTANPPLNCPEIVRVIDIPDCDGCPQINAFTHTIKGCIQKGSECCRKIAFEIEGVFCGQPEIRIDYGDGNFDQQIIQNDGLQTLVFENEYCAGGNYTVNFDTTDPSTCPMQSITVNVPNCDPKDCLDCCPIAIATVESYIDSKCNDDLTKDVTIKAQITPTPKNGCPSNVYAEMYIDGVLVDSGSGSSSFNLSHAGSYSCLEHQVVIRYPDFDCPPFPDSFCVSVCESTKCLVYRNLFTLFTSLSISSFVLFLFNTADLFLAIVAVGALLVATFVLYILWNPCRIACKSCPLKLAIWQISIATFLSFLWLSKSSIAAIISWLSSTLSPLLANIILILLLLLIILILWLLYDNWKSSCCPTKCEIWLHLVIVLAMTSTIVLAILTPIINSFGMLNRYLLSISIFGINIGFGTVITALALLAGYGAYFCCTLKNCK